MAVDHTRPLPVAPERLQHLSLIYFGIDHEHLTLPAMRELAMLALAAEQVEHTERVSFFLQEAHEIYNGRFR